MIPFWNRFRPSTRIHTYHLKTITALGEALLISKFPLHSSGMPVWAVKLSHKAFVRPGLTQNLQGLVCLRPLSRRFRLAFEMEVKLIFCCASGTVLVHVFLTTGVRFRPFAVIWLKLPCSHVRRVLSRFDSIKHRRFSPGTPVSS